MLITCCPSSLSLTQASGAPGGRWKVLVSWIATRVAVARQRGALIGGAGFEQSVLGQLCALRAKMGTIADGPVDRMPLAYVHIVQAIILARDHAT